MSTDPVLKALGRLEGTWATEASHPAFPGVTVRGSVTVEWLAGKQFLIHRACTDHPDFPDSISIIGNMERDRDEQVSGPQPAKADKQGLRMHYFDSRGVFRDYAASIDDEAWRWELLAPGFSQRFSGRFADGGDTIVGTSQLCEDDRNWKDDLQITYRREPSR